MLAQWKKSPLPHSVRQWFYRGHPDLGEMAFTVPMPVAPVISPKTLGLKQFWPDPKLHLLSDISTGSSELDQCHYSTNWHD